MAQYNAKQILLEYNADKEIRRFPRSIQKEFVQLIKELAHYGFLKYPNAKKFSGHDLFEIRIKNNGIYRFIYCYTQDFVLFLCAFKKKMQKTPLREIEKAKKRKQSLI